MRVRAPRRASLKANADSAAAVSAPEARSAPRPKLPRLNPISVSVKAYISDETLLKFQCAERTAATYFKFDAQLDWIDRVDDPVAFYLVVHEYAPNISVTVDYRGEDLQALAQRARDLIEPLMTRELAVAAEFLRADFPALVAPFMDAFETLREDIAQDPEAAVQRLRGPERQRYLPDDRHLFDLFAMVRGFRTLRDTGCFKPLVNPPVGWDMLSTTQIFASDAPEMRNAQRLLLHLGQILEYVGNCVTALPEGLSPGLPESVAARIAEVSDFSEALRRQLDQEVREQTDALFRARAERLIELSDDEHLRLSLKQGFPSRATYFHLLQKTLIERIRDQVIRPLVASGVLPSEAHAQVVFVAYHDGGEPLENGFDESRSPSLAALKVFAGLRDFLCVDEIAQAFGVRSDLGRAWSVESNPMSICYRVSEADDWIDEDSLVETDEMVVIRDLFTEPLAPRADYLQVRLGSRSTTVAVETDHGGAS
ncbi:hypothetical protein THIOKS12070030 [Thiocapsa sp. KS1]|nr:hypothetical protein THIOKS12070030 [Thiocapsa sp. KS1]